MTEEQKQEKIAKILGTQRVEFTESDKAILNKLKGDIKHAKPGAISTSDTFFRTEHNRPKYWANAGMWALLWIIIGVLCCLTIIGIPLGVIVFLSVGAKMKRHESFLLRQDSEEQNGD